jgi:cellulose synthase/poly-beta-1,6-N-acetylglucosamine synthase-like glycosyltransferase
VVIVPVKGVDDRLEAHLQALRQQDYPRYRLVFVVESKEDPAYAVLERLVNEAGPQPAGTCQSIALYVAGRADRGGQKVHNLEHALRQLGEDDEAVAFADADAVPDEYWLGRLMQPLGKPDVGASTGYRWLVPQDERLSSRVGSVLNASVATLLGPARRNMVWGGSAAMLRSTLEEGDLESLWEGTLSDDCQMTRAVSRTGRRVYFVARCLVASPVSMTWGRLFEFGRRQYLIMRVHHPRVWLAGLFGTGLYVGGWISAIAALAGGVLWALPVMAVVYLGDRQRGRMRRQVVKEVFDQSTVRQLAGVDGLERWATPLWMAVHLLIVVSSAVGRRITWAGITYELRGPQDVRVVQWEDDGPGTGG